MSFQRALTAPARLVPIAFLGIISVGTVLLALPVSRAGPGRASLIDAVFTATSATCVTGLAAVDTGAYWSPFGQAVILALVQLGGLGIMAGATLLGLLVARRLGIRTQLAAQAETKTLQLGDVRGVLGRVIRLHLLVESVLAVILFARFALSYDYSLGQAAWHGVFHSVMSFNNAGFALYSDSLTRFASDPIVCLTIAVAIILGGIGFPVIFELRREFRRPASWTIHTKITVMATVLLLIVGTLAVLILEWTNPDTLGSLSASEKLLASFFQGVQPRSSGYNTLDYGAMNDETLIVTIGLMFIGGGSAGTAGGIKVTTFFLLAFVIWAEIRGERDVVAFGRRVSSNAQRQALTVALLGVGLVAAGTLSVLILSDELLTPVLFEVTSAFGTVGLSTGITPDLPAPALAVLSVLIFVGRVGTVTVGAALALRNRDRLYRYPEEQPIVG